MLTKTYHPDYSANQENWEKSSDVFNNRVKSKGEKYLPIVDMLPDHVENNELSDFIKKKYKEQILPNSVFYNFVNPTVDAVVGSIFRKPPAIQLSKDSKPSNLDYLLENADGKGNGLSHLAKDMCYSIELDGRGGFLVDVPTLTNMRDLKNGDIAPRIKRYAASQIIDWDTEYRNGSEVLTFLSLYESRRKRNGGIGVAGGVRDLVERILNFYLDDEGHVYYEVKEDGEETIIDYQMKNGKPANKIPFHFCGSISNDSCVDPAPAHTLVELDLIHYRMLSRDMQARFDMGQLQWSVDLGSPPADSGVDIVEMMAQLNPHGFIAGSSIPAVTAYGGSVSILQANESNLLSKAPLEIEEKAVKIGAQLFSDSGSNETATAANIRASSSTASMSSIAKNVGIAMYNAIVDLAGYINYDDSNISFSLNMDFYESKLSPQDKLAYVQMIQNEVLPKQAYFEILKNNGDVKESMTYDEYEQQLMDDYGAGGMPDLN